MQLNTSDKVGAPFTDPSAPDRVTNETLKQNRLDKQPDEKVRLASPMLPNSQQLREWTTTDKEAHTLIVNIREAVAQRHSRDRLHEPDSFVLFSSLPLELKKRVAVHADCHTQFNLTQTCSELRTLVISPDSQQQPHLCKLAAVLHCLPFTIDFWTFNKCNYGDMLEQRIESSVTLYRFAKEVDISLDRDGDLYLTTGRYQEWYPDWDVLLGHPGLQQQINFEVTLVGSGSVHGSISRWYSTIPNAAWSQNSMQIWIEDDKDAHNACKISIGKLPHKTSFLDTKDHCCRFEREVSLDWSQMPLGCKWAILFVRECVHGLEGDIQVFAKDEFNVNIVSQLDRFLWQHNTIEPEAVPWYEQD